MKKIISMLLAVSMSLSVMCSSFTASAVDGNEAAQTEGSVTENAEQPNNGFGGLFGNEINEKLAAQSANCGISTVEVNGNTAAVKYWTDRDCTVIVGIYADDGTKGTHMVTFGTAQVKAAETDASVTIDNLPQYFYLKAYIVDSESYRPLAEVYDNSTYTEAMKDFDNLTVYDFNPDRVWNFDEDPTDNFMVLADKTVVINTDHEISTSDITYSATSLTINKADTDENIAKLRRGDSFMIFHKEADTNGGVLTGVVSSVSVSDNTAVINYTSAEMRDLFRLIKLDIDDAATKEMNEIESEEQGELYSAKRSMAVSRSSDDKDYSFSLNPGIKATWISKDGGDFKWKGIEARTSMEPLSNKLAKGELQIGFRVDIVFTFKYLAGDKNTEDMTNVNIDLTPTAEASANGEFDINLGANNPLRNYNVFEVGLPLITAGGIPIVTLNLNIQFSGLRIKANIEGKATWTVTYNVNYDSGNGEKNKGKGLTDPKFSTDIKNGLDISATLSVAPLIELLDTGFNDQYGNDITLATVAPTLSLKIGLSLENDNPIIEIEGKERHVCHDSSLLCLGGEVYITFAADINIDLPIFMLSGANLSWTFKIAEINVLEKYLGQSKFHINADGFNWGECDNYAYRTYVQLVEETTKKSLPLKDFFIAPQKHQITNQNYEENFTDSTGKATLYLKKGYAYEFNADTIKPNDDFYPGKETISISDADETHTISLKLRRAPDSITPVPEEDEEIPVYMQGEGLRYTGVTANYDIDGVVIAIPVTLTEDMIKEFDTSEPGIQPLVLDYKGTKWSQQIEVITGKLDRVFLSPIPKKTKYMIGEALDLSPAELNAVYKNPGTGESHIKKGISISADMVSGFDSSTEGEKEVVITYTDANGDTAETSFKVTVVDEKREVESIEINTLPNKTEYVIGESLDISGLTVDVYFSDGTSETEQPVSMAMVSGFDSSTAGTKNVTVTYTDQYDNTAADEFTVTIVDESEIIEIKVDNVPYESRFCEVNKSPNLGGVMLTVIYGDGHEETIPVTQKMITCDTGKAGTTPVNVEYKGLAASYMIEVVEDAGAVICGLEYSNQGIREFDLESIVKMEKYYEGGGKYGWISNMDVWYTDGQIRKPISLNFNYFDGKKHEISKVNIPRCDSAIYWLPDTYKGPKLGVKVVGFDPLTIGMKTTYVYLVDENEANIPGIEPIEISVLIKGSTKNMALANGEDITEQDTTEPTVTEPVVTEPENTETTVTDSAVTEPVVTEFTVTEPEVTETQVVTSAVEESPVMGNESTGVFGFGRAGKKTAQYANLHKNDIYNYYVVRSAAADILGKDNLLFVGQTSSDGNGSLSFEYETVTGEDGEIILKPMSDDPATPDTPSKPDDTNKPDTPTKPTTPTVPDNNGSNGSGSTSPSVVVPVGGTTTETMTVKVENKVTGKKSKAVAKKTGSSVTIKLGTENDGYYANVYTTDDEFVASAIIENGRAKFNAPDGVKLAVVIDKIPYGEDVSSAAGVFGDSAAENMPYAAVTAVIAIVGIYFKRRSEKKVK